jgi:hypothetical protein
MTLLLLSHGAKANHICTLGHFTALTMACSRCPCHPTPASAGNTRRIVRMLIDNKADVDHIDDAGVYVCA